MAKGYDVVDNSGNVVQSGTPNDINILKRAYEQHVEEIKELRKEIAELKSQLKAEPVKQSKLFGTEIEDPKIENEPVEKKTASKRTKKSV